MSVRATLIFVNDDSDFLAGLVRYCRIYGKQEGIEASFSTEPKSVLRTWAEQHYDLVVADVRMSPMDGLDFVKQLPPGQKVVLMSEVKEAEKEIEARMKGYSCFIKKPDIGDPNGMHRFFQRLISKLN